MPEPAITLGRTDADGQTVDVWLGEWPHQAASIRCGGRSEGLLIIREGCPSDWVPVIVEMFELLRADHDVDLSRFATHRLRVEQFRTTLEPLDGVRSDA